MRAEERCGGLRGTGARGDGDRLKRPMDVSWVRRTSLADSAGWAHASRVSKDWRTSSDADLRAQGREAEDPEALAGLVHRALRRGELPGIGRAAADLPPDVRDQLARARVHEGLCSWCGGGVHKLRSGERACCCQDCFVEVGALCLSCPKRARSQGDAALPLTP